MRQLTRSEVHSLVEFNERKSLTLDMFRPLKHQEPIFLSQAKYGLYLGGNRSGKTTCAAVKFAAQAMDLPVTLSDGTQVHQRREHQRGKCLRMWCIGYDQRCIGQSLHRILFKGGELFRVIQDKETNRYRAWQRWNPDDAAREKETRGSPALIPERFIKPGSWSWEDRSNRVFQRVTIQCPVTKKPTAEIFAYSSKAEPKASDPVDIIWIDEHIEYATHLIEWRSRLVDRAGILYWSSWPQTDNEALYKFSLQCDEDVGKPNPTHECVRLTMSGNITLSQKDKDDFLAGCQSDEEKLARDQGLFVTEQFKMYPLFNPSTHSAIRGIDESPDELSKILEANNGVPPADWTRDLILDPGTQHPAVLLCCVPPPKFGDYYVVYDEWYKGRADADQLAAAIRSMTMGQRFYRFIIDQKAGKQVGMGYGMSVMANYSRAFAAHNLIAAQTGNGFQLGCTDVGGRVMQLQSWMHVSSTGLPKLRIVTHKCPNLCKQLERYKKKVVNKEVRDDRPADGQAIDVAVALEYWAASYPRFVRLDPAVTDGSPGYQRYMKLFGNKKKDPPPVRMGTFYRAT